MSDILPKKTFLVSFLLVQCAKRAGRKPCAKVAAYLATFIMSQKPGQACTTQASSSGGVVGLLVLLEATAVEIKPRHRLMTYDFLFPRGISSHRRDVWPHWVIFKSQRCRAFKGGQISMEHPGSKIDCGTMWSSFSYILHLFLCILVSKHRQLRFFSVVALLCRWLSDSFWSPWHLCGLEPRNLGAKGGLSSWGCLQTLGPLWIDDQGHLEKSCM